MSDITSIDGLAQAMSQLIKEYDENIGAWETFATTSANQSITVTINGNPVTIPGIGKLAQKGSNGALSIDQGGTGATTAESARSNLGLGSSATRNAYSSSGDMLSVGDFGVGAYSEAKPTEARSSFISETNASSAWAPANGAGYQSCYAVNRIFQMWIGSNSAGFSRFVSTNNPQEPKANIPWTQYQASGTSDINFKAVTGDLDLNESLNNIEAMDFKTFYYLADEAKTTRRGVIAQDLEKIDPQYVHSAEESGKMTLDLNPLVLDALAAIKALAIRVSALEGDAKPSTPGSFVG
ncbi:tail fiber domain-containing protein [Enterobacter hormaechei]|nr:MULTISPECIES: tail fiber domain-containing protein [Enterobacter]